jgi:hypothetical protein
MTLHVHITAVNTTVDNTITLDDLAPSNTFENVKQRIQNQEGIPLVCQRLTFEGHDLDDALTLNGNILIGSTVELGIIKRPVGVAGCCCGQCRVGSPLVCRGPDGGPLVD